MGWNRWASRAAFRAGVGALLLGAGIGTALVAPGQATAAPRPVDEGSVSAGILSHVPGRQDVASPYVGTWGGHGRGINIYANGFAKVSVASGASNYEKWDARWRPAGRGIVVTFVRRTESAGDVGAGIHRGTKWYGSLKRVRGYTVLEFDRLPGVYWCTRAGNNAGLCGA